MRPPQRRLEPQGLIEVVERLVFPPRPIQHPAPKEMEHRRSRGEGDRLAIVGQRVRQVPHLFVGAAPIDQGGKEIRLDLESGGIIGDRQIVLFHRLVNRPAIGQKIGPTPD